jgi:hypothetical protein
VKRVFQRHRAALTLITIFLPFTLRAQTLQIHAQSLSAQEGTATIELTSAAGQEPLALQWELSFPETIQLDPVGASIGEPSGKAGKSIRCAILANRQGKTQTCRCLVSGGTNRVPNGPVAILKYSAASPFRAGRYGLELKKGLAVTNDMKKLALKDARAEIVFTKP